MMQPTIFGGNTGLTYDQIQKQRDIANELLLANMSTPQNVGEGLSAIGRALAAKAIDKRTTRADEANRAAYEAKRGDLFGAINGTLGGGSAAPAQAPISYSPNSPQGVAGDTMAALGKTEYAPGDRDSFVAAMMPHAMRVSQATGLDPRLVIAQAAQETGWGKSAPNNNFFGIKSHGKEGGANLGTFEYVQGQPVNVNDSFRTYGGMGESADDYARFLRENPRYKEMLSAGDLDGQLAALGASGYATDPNYSASVGSIARSIQAPGLAPAQPAQGQPAQPAINPAILMQLAEIQGNPYASESDKAIANVLMGQVTQAMDPMRQMEMERARLELDALKNPQPDQTDDMREYEFAKTQGYTGTFQDFVIGMKKAGASNTTVSVGGAGEVGTIPQGFELFTDPATGARSMRPIPGGPAAAEAAVAARSAGTKADNAEIASDTLTTAATRAMEAADARAFGATGQDFVSGWFPQSDAAETERQVKVLKSQAIVGNLQAMRNASPTGGALGAVTAPELELLADQAGALNPNSPNFKRDVEDYTKTLLRTIHGPEVGTKLFDEWKGGGGDGWTVIDGVRVREKK